MIDCPADKVPWRETADGPMPLLVPADQVERWRQRYSTLWIEAMPEGMRLYGRAISPKEFETASKLRD